MIFINKANVDAGQVKGTTTLPTNERNTALQAVRYNENSELFVNTSNSPLSTDQYTQGCRFDANGAMYVRPVETLGVPSNISYDGGFAFDGTTNALLVTTQPLARYMIGWPMDQRGFVCMDISSGVPGSGTFNMSIPGPTTNTTLTVTVVNNDTYALTKITFDLSTTFSFAPGNPPLQFRSNVSQNNGTITTAVPFGANGDSTFGFDFTGFTIGKTFVFTWTARTTADPTYAATVLEVDLTKVSIVTSAGPAADSYMEYGGTTESGQSSSVTPSPP